ncbi:MAG: GvpL/GvpF family gas vesicle protein [Methanophagales archaeon]|nr:GvpL/GvpF family gas vesicle protein [Methanophagales archaeon]
MSEKNRFRGIIAEITREEIEAMVREAKGEIAEIVRAELRPGLMSAVREAISKELESAVFGYKVEGEEEREIAVLSEKVFSQPQKAMAEENEEKEVVTPVTTSDDEPTMAMEAGGDQRQEQKLGLYLYGIADANAQTKLGEMGIEGNEVYTIPFKELSAIVHDCPLEPYNSEDEEVVKGWVKTHQHVLDVAEEKFGTVIPFGFDTIIKPEGENNATAKETLKKWMAEEFDSLKEKIERIRGKKEYGVQIFYIPSVMSEKIAENSEEIRKIKEEMKSKPPGMAYMYKQKLENAIKKEMESRMNSYFKNFYERIKRHVEEIKVEKTKKTDEKDKQMIMNLSCLVANDMYKALGTELEEMDKEEGFSVRFTGPWPAYSFV